MPLKITFDYPVDAETAAALAILLKTGDDAPAPAPEKAARPTRAAATKTAAAAANAAAAAQPAATAQAAAAATAPVQPTPAAQAASGPTVVPPPTTLKEVIEESKALAGDKARGGREAFVQLLNVQWKCATLAQIPAEKLAQFMQELKAVGRTPAPVAAADPLAGLVG